MAQGTRGEFFQSINQIDGTAYPEMITSFFEEFSVLYNIIGGYDNLQISKNYDQFSFSIHAPSPAIASEILMRASGDVINVYGRTFSISVQQQSPVDLIISIK